jgi:hypothetical protein
MERVDTSSRVVTDWENHVSGKAFSSCFRLILGQNLAVFPIHGGSGLSSCVEFEQIYEFRLIIRLDLQGRGCPFLPAFTSP